jgi:hypothetical protein
MNAVAVLMRISICPVTGDAGLPERKSAGCRDDFLQRLIVRAFSDVLTDGRGFDYVNAVLTVDGCRLPVKPGGCCGSGLWRAR